MAATNFTPISLYYSTTASAVPSAGNLVAGELALNTVDEKLYFKNSAGTVKLLASNAATTPVTPAGSNTQIQFNNSGAFGASSDLTWSGTVLATLGLTVTNGASIQGLTVGRGGGSVSTNTAVGASALAATATGNRNTGVGSSSLSAVTSGAENTSVGFYGLLTNTTGGFNTAVGSQSLSNNSTGSYNTAIGQTALAFSSTASNNTAVGYQAVLNNSIGTSNTAIGVQSLYNNTTSSNNVAVGESALRNNTTASNNTAVGYQAGYSNTTGTILAIGPQALYLNTTGARNTAVGTGVTGFYAGPMYSNTTGSSNSAFGTSSLINNSTGSNNTAIGDTALFSNTTASSNTAVGYQAGYSQAGTGGDYNTLLGYRAGYTNVTGAVNTYIGTNSGYLATTSSNTFVGVEAGYYITSGAKNTIIGRYTGNQGGLDIRTSSNYIVLSDGDGNPRMYNNGTDWYDAAGKLRAIPQSGSAKTSSYTLATTDVGEYIQVGASGAIVVPDATFATGDVVSIFNNTSGNITMTMSITTAYIGGTDSDKATITLATRGVATVLFISGTVCVVNGNVS